MNNLSPYGQCHICGAEIAIPGSDAFKCGGECNQWVRAEKRPHQILPLPVSPRKTPKTQSQQQSQQFSLFELGGEG